MLSPIKKGQDEDEPRLLAGTQTLKCSVSTPIKCLKDIVPDDVNVDSPSLSEAEDSDLEMSPSKPAKQGAKQGRKNKGKWADSWIWPDDLTGGANTGRG
ncbi:hypothetical protein C8R44DRAFT_890278 [Mycena epipterygia]|nr:hypothetical protein C8R44DRAFT_890278 [Mycena epipterygia]